MRKATNNPRQIRVQHCTCELCIAKYRPGTKATRKTCVGTWQARYRDPAGTQRHKNFPTKREAEAFLDETRTKVRSGTFVGETRAGITLAQWHAQWWPAQRAGDTTMERKERAYRVHVLPHFGDWPLKKIGYLDVEAWVGALTRVTGTPSIIKAFQVLDQMLGAAVRDKRLPHNPCDGVKLPRLKPKHPDDEMPPTYDQLAMIRSHIPEHYHPLLVVAEETGLRWGELAGLRRCWVSFRDKSVQVREVIIEVAGTPKRKAYPKSAAGCRTVPLTDRAARVLERHLEANPAKGSRTAAGSGMHAEELVFRGPQGGVLKRNNFRRLWVPALEKAGVLRETVDEVTGRKEIWPHVHDIRHALASRLHAAGVSEADVQRLLGHERGGKITWLYTHAGQESLNTVRSALDPGAGLRVVGS